MDWASEVAWMVVADSVFHFAIEKQQGVPRQNKGLLMLIIQDVMEKGCMQPKLAGRMRHLDFYPTCLHFYFCNCNVRASLHAPPLIPQNTYHLPPITNTYSPRLEKMGKNHLKFLNLRPMVLNSLT